MIPNQLQTFLAVVKNGNFSSAARRLGISSAAVSKSVAQLEKSLEVRLFHRTTHSLTLTEDGLDLHRRTGHLVEQLEDQIRLSSDKKRAPHGTLKVNLPDSFGRMVVLPLLPAFMEKYPEIQLDLRFDDRLGDLVKEGADVGIGVMMNPDSRVIAREFYRIQPILVASNAYIERHGLPETPADLARHNCIALRSATTGRIKAWNLKDNGEHIQFEPKGNLIVNNIAASMKAAEMGLGISLAGVQIAQALMEDTCCSEELLQEGCIQRVLQPYEPDPIQALIYYSSRHYLPAKTRLFIDYLMEHAGNAPTIDLGVLAQEV